MRARRLKSKSVASFAAGFATVTICGLTYGWIKGPFLHDSPFSRTIRKVASVGGDCETDKTNPVSFENIRAVVEDCKITSIEGLLAILPSDYMSSFTLLRKSHSSQDASDENPRAIVFGTDAKTIISFNGSSSQKGYLELEAIQYSDQTHDFSFHQINFSAQPNQAAQFDQNIPSCTACHRTPARPNWESYDFWDGTYGQVEDQIKVGSPEDLAFSQFLKNSRNHGRYQYLRGPSDLKAPSIASITAANPDPSVTVPNVGPAYSVSTLPNFRFTFYLDELNFPRIAQLLRQTPDFPRYKYAIYGALFGCGPIPDFLPTSETSSFTQSYADVLTDTQNKMTSQYTQRILANSPVDTVLTFDNQLAPQNFEATFPSRFMVAKLRYLLENRGVSMRDWSLAPNPDAYTFSDGELYFKEVARSFESDLLQTPGVLLDYVNLDESSSANLFGDHAKDFAGLKRLSCCSYDTTASDHPSAENPNCTALRTASLHAFGVSQIPDRTGTNLKSTQINAPVSSQSASDPINKCLFCHRTDNGSGLVFGSSSDLTSQLSKSGFEHGTLANELKYRLTTTGPDRMPPNGNALSDTQRLSLLKTITSPN